MCFKLGEGGNLNKWFVGVFVFFGVFATLLSTVPSLFQAVSTSTTVQDKDAIAVFTAHNITVYNNTLSINLDQASENFSSFGLPSPQQLHFWWNMPPTYNTVGISHQKQALLGWWWDFERLEVQEPYASLLEGGHVNWNLWEADIVTNLWDSERNATFVVMASSQVRLNLLILPRNDSLTIQESWDAGELTLYTSYNIDWTETGAGMWNILFQLLTFQNPNLGVAGVFGAILGHGLSLFLWGSIAVIAFAIITSLIPTVSGWRG